MSDTLLAKNKLFNMKKQLEILIQKKIRLENEIFILRKSIKGKQKSFEMKIKTSINLEAYDEKYQPTPETRNFIEENLPDVISLFKEFDDLNEEIFELLNETEKEDH